MSAQPEALRLADAMDVVWAGGIAPEAAAELRRLHAENENLRMTLRVEESCSFRTQMQQYAAQRDELLEALRSVWLWMENQADGQSKGGHATFDLMLLREQRDIARAAIAKATGETK